MARKRNESSWNYLFFDEDADLTDSLETEPWHDDMKEWLNDYMDLFYHNESFVVSEIDFFINNAGELIVIVGKFYPDTIMNFLSRSMSRTIPVRHVLNLETVINHVQQGIPPTGTLNVVLNREELESQRDVAQGLDSQYTTLSGTPPILSPATSSETSLRTPWRPWEAVQTNPVIEIDYTFFKHRYEDWNEKTPWSSFFDENGFNERVYFRYRIDAGYPFIVRNAEPISIFETPVLQTPPSSPEFFYFCNSTSHDFLRYIYQDYNLETPWSSFLLWGGYIDEDAYFQYRIRSGYPYRGASFRDYYRGMTDGYSDSNIMENFEQQAIYEQILQERRRNQEIQESKKKKEKERVSQQQQEQERLQQQRLIEQQTQQQQRMLEEHLLLEEPPVQHIDNPEAESSFSGLRQRRPPSESQNPGFQASGFPPLGTYFTYGLDRLEGTMSLLRRPRGFDSRPSFSNFTLTANPVPTYVQPNPNVTNYYQITPQQHNINLAHRIRIPVAGGNWNSLSPLQFPDTGYVARNLQVIMPTLTSFAMPTIGNTLPTIIPRQMIPLYLPPSPVLPPMPVKPPVFFL